MVIEEAKMPELKVEDAKKDLNGILEKEKSAIQKSKEMSMSDEERKSLEAKQAEDKKKAEEARIAAETQAKKDAELLAKKDEEITDAADKKRKTELLEKQRKDEDVKLSAEEKIKRIKDESQKRIDEVVNRLKEIEDKSSKDAQLLRQELETLRKEKTILEEKISKPPKDEIISLVEKEEKERQVKYLQEDTSKPREERREMSKDELDDWMLEDQVEAIAWINRREIRRAQEKYQNLATKQLESKTKNLLEKQIQSFSRVLIKHPELDIKKRKDELKGQGKSEAEIEDILQQENPKYKLSLEIASEHPEWRTAENAPELLATEIEKRLGKSSSSGTDEKEKEIDELKKTVEALTVKIAAIENPPDEGITSTVARERAKKERITEGEKILIQTMRDAKAPQSAIDSAVKKYRAKIEGASA
jgi:hypothetical protein